MTEAQTAADREVTWPPDGSRILTLMHALLKGRYDNG
jgi:hypothetical protein